MRGFQHPHRSESSGSPLGVEQGPFCGRTCPRGSMSVCGRRLLGLWGPQCLVTGYPGHFHHFCCRVDAVRLCARWGAHSGDLPGRGAARQEASFPFPRRSLMGGGTKGGSGGPGLPCPPALPVPPTWSPVLRAVEPIGAPGLHIHDNRDAG